MAKIKSLNNSNFNPIEFDGIKNLIRGMNMTENKIIVFESKQIRRIWHNEEWYFSVIDIVGALTDSIDAGAYWRKLKQRLNHEGSEVVTFCHGLKLEATDVLIGVAL